jgi:diguanylate cyclase (GGDEF)-like protein
MRITQKIFVDLTIFMIGLGVIVGLVFPFFCTLLGFPKEIVFRPLFFLACVVAGILLAIMNISLARRIIGRPIKELSHKMQDVEMFLGKNNDGNNHEECTPEKCFIDMNSQDELGESANSFNKLVQKLWEVLQTKTVVTSFSEMLNSYLELSELSNESLKQLITNTEANGGAILIEKSGELNVEASMGIKNPIELESNERILELYRSPWRHIIQFPEDIRIDGIVLDFKPRELLIEPISYKNVLIGIVLLVSAKPFTEATLEKLSLFSQSLSLAFRNAITHSQMQKLAAIDVLTGLYNRRFGIIRLKEEYERAVRTELPVSLIMFDIDHFKQVNDTYGHLVGDKVLISIANTAASALRQGDSLLRYGGEEFLCVLPGANQKDARIVAERMRMMVMDNVVKNFEQEIKVTISLGTATLPHPDITNSEQLIRLADEAMYMAKESGRNNTVSY